MIWRTGVMSPALLTSGFIFVCQKDDKKHSPPPCQLQDCILRVLGLPKRFTFQTEEKSSRNKNLVYPNCLGKSLKESGKREGYIFTTAGEGRSNWLNLFCEAWLRIWGCAYIFSLTLLAASWDGHLHIHSINKKSHVKKSSYQLKADSGLLTFRLRGTF